MTAQARLDHLQYSGIIKNGGHTNASKAQNSKESGHCDFASQSEIDQGHDLLGLCPKIWKG